MAATKPCHYILVSMESPGFLAVNMAYSLQIARNRTKKYGQVPVEIWLCGIKGLKSAAFEYSKDIRFIDKPVIIEAMKELALYNDKQEITALVRWCDSKIGPIEIIDLLEAASQHLCEESNTVLALMPDGWRNHIPLTIVESIEKKLNNLKSNIQFEVYWGRPHDPVILPSKIIPSYSLDHESVDTSLILYQEICMPRPLAPILARLGCNGKKNNREKAPTILVLPLRAWFSPTHLQGKYDFSYSGLSSTDSHISYLSKVVGFILDLYQGEIDIIAVAPDIRIEEYCQPGLVDKIVSFLERSVDRRTSIYLIDQLFVTRIKSTLDSVLSFLSESCSLIIYSYDSSTALPLLAAGRSVDSFHGLYSDADNHLNTSADSIQYITDSVSRVALFAAPNTYNIQRSSGMVRITKHDDCLVDSNRGRDDEGNSTKRKKLLPT